MKVAGASDVGRPMAKRLKVARALVRFIPREATVTALALAAMGCIALALWPLSTRPDGAPATNLEASGVQVVRPPEAERIDAVLARRGPGLGLRLRDQLAHAIAEESRAAGFDPLLVLAIIQVESEFLETAVSNMGARGLMQIQPVTLQFIAEREGIRLPLREIESDPALRVRLGIRYLRYLASRFGNDLDLALMAYNAGPTRVYLAMKARELDRFRNYVRAVRREYAGLKLEHGESGDWAFAARETPLEVRQ
jgi:soluble lytic murein transglycosylase-like protein